MCQVTPKTSQIDRDLQRIRAEMGDRHLLAPKVERKTPAKSREQIARDWNERKRLAGVMA